MKPAVFSIRDFSCATAEIESGHDKTEVQKYQLWLGKASKKDIRCRHVRKVLTPLPRPAQQKS